MYNVIFQPSRFETPKHVTPQIGETLLQEEKATNGVANQPASTYSRGSVLAGGGARITLVTCCGKLIDVAPQGRYVGSTPWKDNQTKGETTLISSNSNPFCKWFWVVGFWVPKHRY